METRWVLKVTQISRQRLDIMVEVSWSVAKPIQEGMLENSDWGFDVEGNGYVENWQMSNNTFEKLP